MNTEAKIVLGGLGFASILWGVQGVMQESQIRFWVEYTSPELLGPLIKYSFLLLFGIVLFLSVGVAHVVTKYED